MTPVLTARIIWSSASSEVPEVVCCVTAGIHGGGSYKVPWMDTANSYSSVLMHTAVSGWEGAASSFNSMTMAKDISSFKKVDLPVKRVWTQSKGRYWLTSQIQLSDLCFDHVELDKKRSEILDERCRCHSFVYASRPLRLVALGTAISKVSLPCIFVISLYLNHGVNREEKPLQSNLFLILDHYCNFVNFTLYENRINVAYIEYAK